MNMDSAIFEEKARRNFFPRHSFRMINNGTACVVCHVLKLLEDGEYKFLLVLDNVQKLWHCLGHEPFGTAMH
jgi:hypothetical protein